MSSKTRKGNKNNNSPSSSSSGSTPTAHHKKITLLYRTVERPDLPQVKDLHDVLFPVKYENAFYEKLVTKQAKGILTVIGCLNDKIVSVATARVSRKRSCSLRRFFVTEISGYIMTIGVDPNYRRQGLGAEILRKILFSLHLAGCQIVNLDVKADNKAAVSFYKKNGFNEVQQKDSFYLINDKYYDAYEMAFKFHNTVFTREEDLADLMKPRGEIEVNMIIASGGAIGGRHGPSPPNPMWVFSIFVCIIFLILIGFYLLVG